MTIHKRIIFLLIFFILLSSFNFPKVLVLPFRIDKNMDKSHFWFSKAFSFYLSIKLNSINIDTFTDAKVSNIINANSINFPYRFTKASAIKIGLRNNASKIIWGEIKSSKTKNTDAIITIRPYIINIKSFKQQYLPIIKSKIKNLSLIQHELFNSIIKKVQPSYDINNNEILSINNQSYELLIKSLLTNNFNEKKHLLKNALNLITNKDQNQYIELIRFELSSLFFNRDDFNTSNKYLERISKESIISKNKRFLSGMLDFKNNKYNIAINKFLELKKQNSFKNIIDNNLGVLYIKNGAFSKAETFLNKAIKMNMTKTSFNNILNLYLRGTDLVKLKAKTIEALSMFPKDINYISLLYHFINKNKYKDTLLTVFNDFIDKENIIDYYKLEIKLELFNPFSNTFHKISDNLKKNIETLTIEDCFFNLENYPFDYKTHYTISKLYIKSKQFRKAELYGISALFLNKSALTINNMIDLYKLLGNYSKVREFKSKLQKAE